MKLLKDFFWLLREVNENYANVVLVLIALVSAYVAYNELVLKKRPFVLPEVTYEIKKDGDLETWKFKIVLINKGNFPGIAKISDATLKIGDETYPTIFNKDMELVLAPQEKHFFADIGYINSTGLKRIRGHEFQSNRVEISIRVDSKAIGDTDYEYMTKFVYFVDVSGAEPVFSVVSQKIE